MSPESNIRMSAHITSNTNLIPAIHSWEIFLQDQDRSPYTIKAFIGDLELLASYLPPDRVIGNISTGDLNHFLQWLQKGRGISCSPKSLARRITSLKAFFRWLNQYGSIMVDPAEKVVQHTVISPLPTILTPEETEKALQVSQKYRTNRKPDARPHTLLFLLLHTGIKKGECLGIQMNHIELDTPAGSILYVRYPNPRNRYKERKIPIPPEWIPSYNEYLNQYQPADVIFPWSPRRLEYLLEDIGKEAGLTKHLSFDMCRWTCAVNDWQNGMEVEKIRQKLGISKIQWREIGMKLRQLGGDRAILPHSI